MVLPFRSLSDLASTDFPRREHPQSEYYDIAPAQQVFEQYGPDTMSVSTWQAQSFGGPAVTMQPFGPPILYPSHEQFHDGTSGNKPSMINPTAPESPMLPLNSQKPPRKRKAATLRAADWKPYKKRILELHIEQKRSLQQVKRMMEAEYGFKAEVRQYRSRVSQWGQDKNIKRHEMQAIVRKHQKRKLVETDKRPLVFEVRGNEVDRQKIERWMGRYNVSDSFLYRPDPAAPTPPAVGCRTISERGSPTPTTITVYSTPASVKPINDVNAIAQNPQAFSSALSLSGFLRSQTDDLAEQTPVLTHHPHPSLQLSFIYDRKTFTDAQESSLQVLYRRDEELRLRGDLVIADLTFVNDARDIFSMMYKLGWLLLRQGRYSAAEEIGWRLLDGHRLLGAGILHTSCLLTLALVEQGAFAKAEVLSRRALQYADAIEHNHAERSGLLHTLGNLLSSQSKLAEAEAVYRQSLDMSEKHFGREHPQTINTTFSLGVVLQRSGRLDEAEAILREALVSSKNVLALEDCTTVLDMATLAEVLASPNEHREAEEMYQRVLALKKKIFGPADLKTIQSKEDLGELLRAQHRYTEAEEVYREALALRKQVLGSEHPLTLCTMSKLGVVLHEQTRYEETAVIFREVLALREKVLGFEHFHTLTSMSKLAHVLCMQERYEEAKAMYLEALALRKKVLGCEDPETLASMEYLQKILERR